MPDPQGLDLAQLQEAMQTRQMEVEDMRAKLQKDAIEKLDKLIGTDTEVSKIADIIMICYQIVNWAGARLSERADMSALMVGVLNEIQRAESGKTFEVSKALTEFTSNTHPWLVKQAKYEDDRMHALAERTKMITTVLKSKVVPLPITI